MSQPAKSYEKVQYEFRPAKQVERRMLLDAFQRLTAAGFAIQDYQYTGLGSIYFIDFIMFHRYLGIRHMLSVEYSPDVEKRVKFNRPFRLVKIEIGDIADQIPQLSPDRRHILWLDYDHVLTKDVVDAVVLASSHLSCGSLLLVTVDVEPPGLPEEGPDEWRIHFLNEARRFLGPRPETTMFGKSKLPSLNASILKKAIDEGLTGRAEVSFCPLFHFLYADGHEMLSLGGMITSPEEARKLEALNKKELPFLREDLGGVPYRIRVPLVTRKERLYLEAAMPRRKDWKPKEFELKREDIEAFSNIYKYYPAYTEMFL